MPIDVRVIDRDGKPITDLTERDFTISENGVPQTIRFFSTHSLTSEASATSGPIELRKAAAPDTLVPQNRRVFLILLGRGHMTGPSKELPALERFLETRLLPQDRVAILAYNRGTDFTTNHQAVGDVGVYAGSGREQPVGEVLRRVDLQLKEATYRAFDEQGASFDIRVPLKERPKFVKVIVYDYAADVLGSAIVTIK